MARAPSVAGPVKSTGVRTYLTIGSTVDATNWPISKMYGRKVALDTTTKECIEPMKLKRILFARVRGRRSGSQGGTSIPGVGLAAEYRRGG